MEFLKCTIVYYYHYLLDLLQCLDCNVHCTVQCNKIQQYRILLYCTERILRGTLEHCKDT